MNSNMVKPEKFDHLHLVYHFTISLRKVSFSCGKHFLPIYQKKFVYKFSMHLHRKGKAAAFLHFVVLQSYTHSYAHM